MLLKQSLAWALMAALALTLSGPVAAAEDSDDELSLSEARERQARGKVERLVTKQLNRAKLLTGGKKSSEDYFLIGFAQVSAQTREMEVKFDSLDGTDRAATYITDYLLTAPPKTARNFRVFGRIKTEGDAEQGLGTLRARWDQYQAFRAEMMRRYRAASAKRC